MRKKSNLMCFWTLICFGILGALDISGQQTGLVSHFQTKPNGALVHVQRTYNGISVVEGKKSINANDILEVNGKMIAFPAGELFEGNAQDIIYTSSLVQKSDGAAEKYLHSYYLRDNKLQKISSTKLADEFISVKPVSQSKNLLANDEWEGIGLEITLYNSSLNKISTYRPFSKGFTLSMSSISGNKAAFVFFSSQENEPPKLVLLDTRMGKIDFETRLEAGRYKITKVVFFGDHILLKQHDTPANQQLLCYSNTGKLLWKKQQYAYALAGFQEKSKWVVFAMDKKNYWFIDPQTGSETPKLSLKAMMPENSIGKDLWIDVSSNYMSSEVALLVSKRDNSSNNLFIHDIYIFRDTRNQATKQKTIRSESKVLSFTGLATKMLLNNSNNQIIYSYEN